MIMMMIWGMVSGWCVGVFGFYHSTLDNERFKEPAKKFSTSISSYSILSSFFVSKKFSHWIFRQKVDKNLLQLSPLLSVRSSTGKCSVSFTSFTTNLIMLPALAPRSASEVFRVEFSWFLSKKSFFCLSFSQQNVSSMSHVTIWEVEQDFEAYTWGKSLEEKENKGKFFWFFFTQMRRLRLDSLTSRPNKLFLFIFNYLRRTRKSLFFFSLDDDFLRMGETQCLTRLLSSHISPIPEEVEVILAQQWVSTINLIIRARLSRTKSLSGVAKRNFWSRDVDLCAILAASCVTYKCGKIFCIDSSPFLSSLFCVVFVWAGSGAKCNFV